MVKKKSARSLAVLGAVVLGAALAVGAPPPVFAQETHEFKIVTGNAAAAVRDFGTQSKTQILASATALQGRTLNAVSGSMSTDEALTKMLNGTGLTYRYVGDRTIALVLAGQDEVRSGPPGANETSNKAPPPTTGSEKKGSENDSSRRFRLAQVDQGSNAQSPALGGKDQQVTAGEAASVQEIVITAQKRSERLIDTPQSVTVLTGDDLTRLGATQFRDFANTVPGLDFSTSGAGFNQISLRGVTAGLDIGPTVGILIDDVPYGSSTSFSASTQLALDAGLFDLDRIEVLRGPQGTLYGASTMGGLIKYVSKQPDADRFGAVAQAGFSGTEHGGLNYNAAAALNVPIASNTVALRMSGFDSHDDGYIDNIALGKKAVNKSDISGARLDLLARPTDALSIRFAGYEQEIYRDGEGTVDYTFAGAPAFGDLKQSRLVAEPFVQHLQVASGTIKYDLDWGSLTSISSYQSERTNYVFDLSQDFIAFFPYKSVGAPTQSTTDKFTQEVRLASEGKKTLDWLIGGFYTRERSENQQYFSLTGLNGQPAPNNLYTFSQPSVYREYAAFADLTAHLNPKLDVAGGIRYADNHLQVQQIGTGTFVGSLPLTRSSASVNTYLANASYHFTDRQVGYLRYATGYRPGGPNFVILNQTTGQPYQPLTFQSDKLKSYEAGYKGETGDRRYSIDLAGYYIDWSNIQIATSRAGVGFIENASGGAGIRGAELTLTGRPVSALTTTGAFAYQNAYLKRANADLGALEGERLPNVPRFTAAINADYKIPYGNWQPTIGATVKEVSDRKSSFDGSKAFPQYGLPAYTSVDLRSGFTSGPVNAQMFVHNLFDRRGELSALYTNIGPHPRVAITQPRTIGITLSTRF